MTVAQWSQVWLSGLSIREGTQTSYDFALSRILPAFGSRPLRSLRQSEIRAWRRSLRTQDGSRELADSTADKVMAVFGTMLRAAVQDELLERSPMPSGKRGQQSVRVIDPAELLTQAQVQAWAQALPVWMQSMPIVAATTGLRQGELLGLRLSNVDFLRRQVRVVEQLRTPKGVGGPVFGPPKTAAAVRTVPLPKVAADALALHLERFPLPGVPSAAGADEYGPGRMEPLKTRPGHLDGEPIFRTQTGLRWRTNNFQAAVVAARRAAGLPDWATWHALRDVAISDLVRGGVDLRTVMAIAGHTDPKLTLITYARLLPDSIDNARQVSDGMWRGDVSRQTV